jgi:[protein-PII] uridylyltransferase
MVYTRDVPDLFVAICGYFDAKSLSVQDARIHTTRHGWALDSFIVLLPEGASDLRAQATLVEHELAERLKDAKAAAQVPPGRGGYYGRGRQSRMSRVFPIMPQAELQPDERSTSWRLSVTATDRPGLLHALARVFAQHEVNLLMAKIMTLGDRVEDVFIVDGAALARPRSQMQFERDILDALAGEEARQQAA